MSKYELENKMKELLELKRMKEELEAEIEAAQDEIKQIMGEDEELICGAYKATWKPVTTQRLDTKGLTAFLGKDALQPFYKTTTTRRFCIG